MMSVQSRYLRSGSLSVMIRAPSRGRMVAAVTRPNLLESASMYTVWALEAARNFSAAASGSGVVKPWLTLTPLVPRNTLVKF